MRAEEFPALCRYLEIDIRVDRVGHVDLIAHARLLLVLGTTLVKQGLLAAGRAAVLPG
ncbi:hypothetical protein GCM10027360_33340 [Amycolatopsis echigonensis]